MVYLASLPIVALILIIGLEAKRGWSWAESILLGSITWLFSISISVEVLDVANAISLSGVAWAWNIGIVFLLLLHVKSLGVVQDKEVVNVDYSTAEYAFFIIIGISFATTLFVALISPPNNWDSQTYHLPRIEHWIQNRSLALYPTAIERQIAYPALAETVILQFRILSGGDRLDNLVQWLAALGSAVAVARISTHLGASRQGSIFASVFAASLPIAILESTSTQNDVVVSFLLLCTAERLLAWYETRSLRNAAYMSMAAGLALSTKGTAYVIGAPFGVYFLVSLARQPRAAIWPTLALCLPLLLLPNLGFYTRNIQSLGSPFGALAAATNNTEFGFGPLALNTIRNIAVNLAPAHSTLNIWTSSAVVHLIRALGLDPNDPATTFPNTEFQLSTNQTHEDFAGNPVHLVLIGIAFVACMRSTSPPLQRRYAVAVLASAVLFLVVFRWNPWITRLQLPLFALAAPIVGCLPILEKRQRFSIALLAVLALSALPALLMNKSRSLVPSWLAQTVGGSPRPSLLFQTPLQIRFANRPEMLLPYEEVARYAIANDHHDIGLLMGGDDWEYPLWRLLQQASIEPLRIEHVFDATNSRKLDYPLGPFKPTLIIATGSGRAPMLTINGMTWKRRLELPKLSVYTSAR